MECEHYRIILVTFLVMVIFAPDGHFSSELPLESSSDDQKDNTLVQAFNGSATESAGVVPSAWPAVLGALTAIFSTALLIAVAVRYRLFRWCLARHRHSLLLEGETASQYSQAGALEGDVPVRGMRGRMVHTGESSDDDDGFIEDNYIQASVIEKHEEEEIQQEDTEDTDDELVIPETD